ncbi:hypothetical protein Taro_002701 [Colocasia esculenta]|uniref:Uncharacterized protein n=1 Tax=Colocasia esculenta TaxID=4460 RepID=A0A843TEW2_COLES|nr:hypothetical protein [Colocasia esculenta]
MDLEKYHVEKIKALENLMPPGSLGLPSTSLMPPGSFGLPNTSLMSPGSFDLPSTSLMPPGSLVVSSIATVHMMHLAADCLWCLFSYLISVVVQYSDENHPQEVGEFDHRMKISKASRHDKIAIPGMIPNNLRSETMQGVVLFAIRRYLAIG